MAECLKNALKRNQERKSDMESENGSEKEMDDDKLEIRDGDMSSHTAAKMIVNGNDRKLKESNLKPSNHPLKFTSYSKRKYTETRENGSHSKHKSKRNNESNICIVSLTSCSLVQFCKGSRRTLPFEVGIRMKLFSIENFFRLRILVTRLEPLKVHVC